MRVLFFAALTFIGVFAGLLAGFVGLGVWSLFFPQDAPSIALPKREWHCQAEHVERRVTIVGHAIYPREEKVCDRYDRIAN